MRLAEKRADDRVMPARLVDGEAAEMIELAGEAGAAFGERAVAKRRSAVDDHPGGLALGMGIDDPHGAQSLAPGQEAYQARNVVNRRFAMLSCDRLSASKSFKCSAYSSWPDERHQPLEIEHEIDALVEDGERRERALKLERKAPRLSVALGGALAKLDQTQHFVREHIADAGDGAAGAAIDEAVEHFGVDADHERDVVRTARDMLRGVAQRFRAAEFLESDQMGKLVCAARRTAPLASGSRNRGCCR